MKVGIEFASRVSAAEAAASGWQGSLLTIEPFNPLKNLMLARGPQVWLF